MLHSIEQGASMNITDDVIRNLRFIERDGKRILQFARGGVAEWQDVPLLAPPDLGVRITWEEFMYNALTLCSLAIARKLAKRLGLES